MSQRKPKRLYRVYGEDDKGNVKTYTFQTKGRAVSTALRWAEGSSASYWWEHDIPKLHNVRVDVSEPVHFPSDYGNPQTIPPAH